MLEMMQHMEGSMRSHSRGELPHGGAIKRESLMRLFLVVCAICNLGILSSQLKLLETHTLTFSPSLSHPTEENMFYCTSTYPSLTLMHTSVSLSSSHCVPMEADSILSSVA